MDQRRLGEMLRARRELLGRTQPEVGAVVGIGKSRVSQIEAGDANAVDTLDDLARALDARWVVYLLPDSISPERRELLDQLVEILDRLDDRDARLLAGMVRLHADRLNEPSLTKK